MNYFFTSVILSKTFMYSPNYVVHAPAVQTNALQLHPMGQVPLLQKFLPFSSSSYLNPQLAFQQQTGVARPHSYTITGQ